jgi:pilus assembly protein CpaE
MKILIASRSATALKALSGALVNAPDISCSMKLVSNGHVDPLHNVSPRPDLLLLRFDAEHLAELTTLAEGDVASRPPLIVVGPAGSAEAFRLSVRAGARDFLVEPVASEELLASIKRVEGDITAVIGAAGGVGTSFLACNLAHSLATETQSRVALVDLDLTYAPLAGFLDVHAERGLLEALLEVESLDEIALGGYLGKHRSGVNVMGVVGEALLLAQEVDPGRIELLVRVLASYHAHVVVDVPHSLDAVSATALGAASHVVIVLQQSVAQVRNAVRLVRLLSQKLGMPRDRIRAVVNRHQKKSTVTTGDIERALNVGPVFAIPSHYESALASLDSGVPLVESDRNSAVGRAVRELQEDLRGVARPDRGNLLRRALPIFSRD